MSLVGCIYSQAFVVSSHVPNQARGGTTSIFGG